MVSSKDNILGLNSIWFVRKTVNGLHSSLTQLMRLKTNSVFGPIRKLPSSISYFYG